MCKNHKRRNHFYEKYRQQQTTSISNNTRHEERKHDLILVRQLLIELAIQWTYTTLFGAYVSHVFIRTGSIMSVIVAHVICNYMGLPDIEFIFSTALKRLKKLKRGQVWPFH